MSVSLIDKEQDEIFHVNIWHWGALVEAVRRLEVLPEETVLALHESYFGHGLTAEQCRAVAQALKARVLPTLQDDERILLDGSRTREPDDFVLHKVDPSKNFSTSSEVLSKFVVFLEKSGGFTVC